MIKLEIIKNLKTNLMEKDFLKICDKFLEVDKKNAESFLLGKNGQLTLVFCDDKEIRTFNKNIRGKDKATDVLSFVYMEKAYNDNNEHESTILGDILISLDTAKKQALEKKHTLEKEVFILFTHGLLHVFGYDHNNDEEELEMEKMSEKILRDFT